MKSSRDEIREDRKTFENVVFCFFGCDVFCFFGCGVHVLCVCVVRSVLFCVFVCLCVCVFVGLLVCWFVFVVRWRKLLLQEDNSTELLCCLFHPQANTRSFALSRTPACCSGLSKAAAPSELLCWLSLACCCWHGGYWKETTGVSLKAKGAKVGKERSGSFALETHMGGKERSCRFPTGMCSFIQEISVCLGTWGTSRGSTSG